MDKDFVPYEQALELKELGFDEPCVYYVDNDNESYIYNFEIHPDEFIEWCGVNVIPTPTFSQAFKWFREKYQMVFCYEPNLKKDLTYIFFIYIEITGEKVFVVESKYDEEAELACLNKLIEIVKNK